MRIISGKNRGQVFSLPKGFKSRVTTDRAKEALFNILHSNFDFTKLKVLDLFAGSGSISFEFISRGVSDIVAVEKNYHNVTAIKSAAEKLKMSLPVIKADVLKISERFSDKKFDIIFADPPFKADFVGALPDLFLSNQLLSPDGWFILEHDDNYSFIENPQCFDTRHYGGVNFSFFEIKGMRPLQK